MSIFERILEAELGELPPGEPRAYPALGGGLLLDDGEAGWIRSDVPAEVRR